MAGGAGSTDLDVVRPTDLANVPVVTSSRYLSVCSHGMCFTLAGKGLGQGLKGRGFYLQGWWEGASDGNDSQAHHCQDLSDESLSL